MNLTPHLQSPAAPATAEPTMYPRPLKSEEIGIIVNSLAVNLLFDKISQIVYMMFTMKRGHEKDMSPSNRDGEIKDGQHNSDLLSKKQVS